jgi:hypothetical protein
LQLALDGDDGTSPFTQAFIKNVTTPGIEINRLFRWCDTMRWRQPIASKSR